MMECWIERGDGSRWRLPTALEWNFSYGTGLPCDSFYLRCLWEGGQERNLSAAALFYASWDGERIFTGVIDEFACIYSEEGRYLELSGRSMAARLLDNEAMPLEYQKVTCADIVENHVKLYGVQTVGGSKLPEVSGFSVSSGVSEWSVVQEFACYYGGIVPYFDRLGRLVLDGHNNAIEAKIDPASPVLELEYREQRHGVLSLVGVRRQSTWDTCWVENSSFLAEGGCARRIVTVPRDTASVAMRYSGDYQLKASRSERVRLRLTLAGLHLIWPGQLVEVERNGFGGNGTYRAAQTELLCNERGLATTLVLGEPDSLI